MILEIAPCWCEQASASKQAFGFDCRVIRIAPIEDAKGKGGVQAKDCVFRLNSPFSLRIFDWVNIPEELPNLSSSAKKITALLVYHEEHLYEFLRDEKHIKIINEC